MTVKISIISCLIMLVFSCNESKKDSLFFEALIIENNIEEFTSEYKDVSVDNMLGSTGASLLQFALSNYKEEIAQHILMENKCDINNVDYSGMTALHYSVLLTNSKITKEILNSGSISMANSIYSDIISQAFLKRHTSIETIKLLLESGAKLEDEEFGPVYSSVIFGQCDKLILLLDSGANLNSDYGREGDLFEVANKYECMCIINNENGIRETIAHEYSSAISPLVRE